MELGGHDVPFDDGDDESLFGSPPPSPSCDHSRSPSPGLALPNTSSAVNVSIFSGAGADGSASRHSSAMTNVGTIALPGSQSVSELSFPPLALSLNQGCATQSVYPMNSRPPAFFETASDMHGVSEETGSPASSSRSSTLDPSKPRKARKRKRAETPLQPAPEISIPDPSQPLPPHFLRNQENLLGRAGLVSRIKASSLVRQPYLPSMEQHDGRERGRTPSDPIIVEDGDSQQQYSGQSLFNRHRPARPRRNRETSSRSPPRTRKPIDPSLLTAPSNQEIVKVLIGQKDIFPVLQSILKLLAGDTVPPPQPSAFQRGQTKKRKLNRVPAGAADWDVPFPFAQGEGPEEYYKNWKKERAKELVSQLLSLIKAAATKAAIRSYYRKQEEEPGKPDKPPKSCHDSGRNGGGTTNAPASFDQLIASLVNAAPGPFQHQTPPLQPNIATTNLDPRPLDDSSTAFNMDALSSSFMPPTPGSEADQPLFNSWMSFLQNFPVSFDQNFLSPPTPATTDSSQPNTPMPMDTDFSLSEFGTEAGEDFERMMSSMFGESGGSGHRSMGGLDFGGLDVNPSANSGYCGDASMDPLFLSLTSNDTFSSEPSTSFPAPPADIQVDSSMDFSNFADCGNFQFNGSNAFGDGVLSPACTSTTSYSGDTVTGPTTPTSANWDGVNVAGDGGAANSLRMEGMWDFWGKATEINGGVIVDEQTLIDTFAQPGKEDGAGMFSGHFAKGSTTSRTATPVPQSAPAQEPPGIPETIQEATALVQEALSSLRNFGKMPPPPPPPRISCKRPETRETILERVEEKKKRLKEQLDKVKRELWEVTIEQAALVRICTGMGTTTTTIISTSNSTSNS